MNVIQDFRLATVVSDMIPEPEEQLPIDKHLQKAVETAHAKNPIHRRIEPLERFLAFCGKLNKCEVYLTIQATFESSAIMKSAHDKLLIALLKYIDRVDQWNEIQEFTTPLHPMFESAMIDLWDASQKSSTRIDFVEAYKGPISLLLGAASVAGIQQAEIAGTAPASQFVAAAMQTHLGSALYCDLGNGLRWTGFLDSVQRQLDDLVYHQFDADEVRSFNTLMTQTANGVQQVGTGVIFQGINFVIVGLHIDINWNMFAFVCL